MRATVKARLCLLNFSRRNYAAVVRLGRVPLSVEFLDTVQVSWFDYAAVSSGMGVTSSTGVWVVVFVAASSSIDASEK